MIETVIADMGFMESGMGWWMGLGAIIWILLIVLIIVIIANWLQPIVRKTTEKKEIEELKEEIRKLRKEIKKT